MNLLLDTHTFLWFCEGTSSLGVEARRLIEDPGSRRLVSVASLWEITIKAGLGRLKLNLTVPDLVRRQVIGNGFELLQILPEHLQAVLGLPFHHRDPFDRLLVAQATTESAVLLSRDDHLDAYGIDRRW